MSNKDAGERIRELWELQNYTREVFAEKVEISEKFLYEIEVGKKGFSADTLCRISQVLSVSCDYIMLGEEKKVICVLETIGPKQRSKVQEVLKMLSEMCDGL